MRHIWGTCAECKVTVSWEASIDAGKGDQLPNHEESFFECPYCGNGIEDGSDPTARWEQEESTLRRAHRAMHEAQKALDDLLLTSRLSRCKDGYVLVEATTREGVMWAATLEDLADTIHDHDEDDDIEETR